MNCRIVFTGEYSHISAIHDALYSYNLNLTGFERSADVKAKELPESAALVIIDDEGNFYGGIAFHWENDPRHIYVDYFFIDDALRGQGWGYKVIDKLVETAVAGNAENITLTTNTFQAPGFYHKCGFTEIGCKDAPTPLNPENKHYTFRKDLR